MNLLVCIDDTDTLETRGTGHLAEELRHELEKRFNVNTTNISRHQLFVNEKIPYTSHNSTMCFTLESDGNHYDDIIEFSASFLEEESAQGSDPGLCVAMKEKLSNTDLLIDFGLRARTSVLTKTEAYSLASQLGIHLSEHGGTGDGVIGALAGIGLRIFGNNGRFRGWIKIEDDDRLISAGDVCSKYNISGVKESEGDCLLLSDMIFLEGKVKTILVDGREILPVKRVSGNVLYKYKNISRKEIKELTD